MVPCYLRAGRVAKVLARAISNTMKILEWIWIAKISDLFNTTVRHVCTRYEHGSGPGLLG